MATFEPSPDLDPAVAQAIQEAMDALRAELLPHLASLGSERVAMPGAETTETRERDRLSLLEEALGALDAATSQAGLLNELLQQAGHFADRTLFLVLDDGRFRGWAAYGFDTDQELVTRAAVNASDGAWGEVADGTAAVSLDADACAELVEQLGSEPAADGMLVVFALRGSTAGALYADRAGTDGALDPSALRILTYVASQALETLPLRRGRRPDVVDTPAPAGDEPAPAQERPAQERTEAVDEPLEPETAVGAVVDVDVDALIEEVSAAGSTEQEILEIRRDTASPPFEPAAEIGATVIDEIEADASTGFETVISDTHSGVETPAEETGVAFETEVPEPGAATEIPDVELPDVELPRAELPDVELPDVELPRAELPDVELPDVELPDVELPDAVLPGVDLPDIELPGPQDPFETEGEDVRFATQEISTLEAALGQEVVEERVTPRPGPRALEPTEVAPPADLEGPGWAFGGGDTITDDTRHEEARRLARLLVTEIKLYNEEKVREGREQSNLTSQLRDDLERSRRIYEERIDEEIRNDTDYFREECVRILAGGDSTALGA